MLPLAAPAKELVVKDGKRVDSYKPNAPIFEGRNRPGCPVPSRREKELREDSPEGSQEGSAAMEAETWEKKVEQLGEKIERVKARSEASPQAAWCCGLELRIKLSHHAVFVGGRRARGQLGLSSWRGRPSGSPYPADRRGSRRAIVSASCVRL